MRDVVVVGAGPGGSAAAYFLARAGADVVLLDKADFPRDKTCGDGLTPRALRVIDDMGLLPEVTRAGCAVEGYEVIAPNGRATAARISSNYGALAVPRQTLDAILQRRALDIGATFERMNVIEVEPSVRGVSVRSGNGTIEARNAVIATGAATGVLLRSGILRRQPNVMLAARAYFEGLSARAVFQLRFDRVPLPGYGWVFPVASDSANVGVGFMPRGGSVRTAAAVFQRFAAPLVHGARQAGPLKGYPIRADFLSAPTFAGRTLLVGEAAGLVNPLTGEGIDYALETGAIAAEHILQQTAPDEYDRALRARFGKLFRFSEAVRDRYCVTPVLNLLVRLANARPALRQQLTDVVLGEREPAGYQAGGMAARVLLYVLRTQRLSGRLG
jgi:menaquinone-9 beta-reductase